MKQLVEFLINNKSAGIIKNIDDEFVDFGLESGTLWGKCNLGADKETDVGGYYQWAGNKDMTNTFCVWEFYPYNLKKSRKPDVKCLKGNFNNILNGDFIESEATIKLEYDIVTKTLGRNYRTPSKDDFQELIDNVTPTYETNYENTGVNGVVLEKSNKYIFIPFGGIKIDYDDAAWRLYRFACLWSNTSSLFDPPCSFKSFYLDINEKRWGCKIKSDELTLGMNIRPVKKK